MAREVIHIATVFNGVVENREFRADHVNITASGDTLSLRLRGGSDSEGRVISALFTPNAVVVRRPVEDGDQ